MRTAIRRAPSARNAAKAPPIGVVTGTPGRASWTRAAIRSSPSTMAAEVQPKATTESGSTGMISRVAAAISPSMAAKVSGVIRTSFQSRLS